MEDVVELCPRCRSDRRWFRGPILSYRSRRGGGPVGGDLIDEYRECPHPWHDEGNEDA